MTAKFKYPNLILLFRPMLLFEHLKDVEKQTANIQTPAYVIDETVLEENLRILKKVKDETGCKILLALKAFLCALHFL